MGLQGSLLGAPRVTRDGEPLTFDTRKATALLAHLALAGRPRSRDGLCELCGPATIPAAPAGRFSAPSRRCAELSVRSGSRPRATPSPCAPGGSSMWADLDHEPGRPDESMSHLKRAVAIFSEVGADEATRLPEIWKLVSW